MTQALDGLRVLDLSRWVAGEFASKLFADFGADVIKIEKPGEGSLTRHWGPFRDDVPDPEASALFLHLNTNKRSLTLDLAEAGDRAVFLQLVETADAIIESFRPGHLEKWDLGIGTLHSVNPKLVVTRISPFGQTGPYRDWEATGIVLQAMGGPMSSTGEGRRAPQRKPGLLEHYVIGRTAGEATLAGLISARRTGLGSIIDVSGQEVLLSGADRRACYLVAGAYSGTNAPRGVRSAHRGAATFTGGTPCRDGYVALYITNMVFWNRLIDLISDGPAFTEKFHDRPFLGDLYPEFVAYLRGWLAERDKQEIMEISESRKIPITAILTISELSETAHFRDRGVFVKAAHPVAGELEYVGAPWRMANGYQLRTTAPLLGQHDEEIRAELAGTRAGAGAVDEEGRG